MFLPIYITAKPAGGKKEMYTQFWMETLVSTAQIRNLDAGSLSPSFALVLSKYPLNDWKSGFTYF
jgi:hypothetical protein